MRECRELLSSPLPVAGQIQNRYVAVEVLQGVLDLSIIRKTKVSILYIDEQR